MQKFWPCISLWLRSNWFNSPPPEPPARHFSDHISKYIFVNEKLCTLINVSLKFVPKGQTNNIPSLFQIMAWRQIGNKLWSEPNMAQFNDAYMLH